MEIPKEGLRLHKSNFQAIGSQLMPFLESGECYRLIIKPWKDKRSLSQNALSHVWYEHISKYLIKAGRQHCNAAWVKHNLKATYLGFEDVMFTDFVTGEVTTRQELKHTSDLDTGDMHYFMMRIEAWAAQFGLTLPNPEDGEYFKLQRKQEE
ncbi:hypothetical protein [Enterobacter sp. R1(2018)]|uniref:hypothetical protein n=1 Tax=Enterobacter sp. R1(2018) TaxID=2447891 RepID=UPI000EB0C12F|nr:hypothetical protein [Enterobacter sp. R1(2018)]RKQ38375.1 hypothetical protein D8M09_17370 [Enterobacter sp. R1(2018)]